MTKIKNSIKEIVWYLLYLDFLIFLIGIEYRVKANKIRLIFANPLFTSLNSLLALKMKNAC